VLLRAGDHTNRTLDALGPVSLTA